MSWIIDISDWSERLYKYSIDMICNFDIIFYDDNIFKLQNKENEEKILFELLHDPVRAHMFWLSFGVGIEILIKSILLKYQILPITNRKITNKYEKKNIFYSEEEKKEYFSDDIAMVYRSLTRKVKAKDNKWIQN